MLPAHPSPATLQATSAFAVRVAAAYPTQQTILFGRRSLNKAEDLRLVADYKSDSIDAEAARWSVLAAKAFIDEVGLRFLPNEAARQAGDS